MAEFARIQLPLFKAIENHLRANRKLIEARDRPLPRLISGNSPLKTSTSSSRLAWQRKRRLAHEFPVCHPRGAILKSQRDFGLQPRVDPSAGLPWVTGSKRFPTPAGLRPRHRTFATATPLGLEWI